MPALEVAQVHVVSQLPLQRARSQFSIGEILRLMAHHRFNRQLFGETSEISNLCEAHGVQGTVRSKQLTASTEGKIPLTAYA